MAAPTNAAKREESTCQLGAVHTWHKCEVLTVLRNVRFKEEPGRHLLTLSSSQFDPKRHLHEPLRGLACRAENYGALNG